MKLDVSDRYCYYCGQQNTTKRLSLSNYFSEFLTSVLTYDSRIVHTIRDLISKPGTISKNYIRGKRVRYANPFRFFLSISIIFFLVNGFLNFIDEETSLYRRADISKDSSNNFNIAIDSLFGNNSGSREATYNFIAERDLDTLEFSSKLFKQIDLFRSFYKVTSIKNAHYALDSLDYKPSSYNIWLYNRNKVIDHIEEDPGNFLSYLSAKTPFYLFFFAPFLALIFLLLYFRWYSFEAVRHQLELRYHSLRSFTTKRPKIGRALINLAAVLVWLFRVRRKINYMEHLIFIFHIFTFIFLGLFICLLPDYFLSSSIFTGIFLAVGPFYFYRALRNFYNEGRFLTIIKFLIINVVFFILGGIIAALFFTITAVTY